MPQKYTSPQHISALGTEIRTTSRDLGFRELRLLELLLATITIRPSIPTVKVLYKRMSQLHREEGNRPFKRGCSQCKGPEVGRRWVFGGRE